MIKSRRGQVGSLGHGRRRAGGKRAQRLVAPPRGRAPMTTSVLAAKLSRKLDALIRGILQTFDGD